MVMISESTPLDDGYTTEIDSLDEKSWYAIIGKFRDANIYQTWAYGAVRFGDKNLSHIIIKKEGQIISAAQTRILRIPFLNVGIAYVRWGPLWRKYDEDYDLNDFRKILETMRQEYVIKRGLFLRIIPNEKERDQKELQLILDGSGFKWQKSDYRTLYLPLNESLEEIRSNLSKNWRKHLNKAEKKGLEVIEGTDQNLFESVVRLYREMLLRKAFEPGINIDDYPKLQERLPDHLKMKIMICQANGKPLSALVGSAIGEVGIELIAASGNESLDLGASYLLRWKMVEYLKQAGCCFYNLNGINPRRNPGGYQFKSGLAGKLGKDIEFLGIFQSVDNHITSYAVKGGEWLITRYNKMLQTGRYLRSASNKEKQ
jgi:lipid II:glycine glycyltransferase (peptidoglycan interpeptide bridge formation enzyme)